MKIYREHDNANPVSCDECGKSMKTSFLTQGSKASSDTGILLCNTCKDKLIRGDLAVEVMRPTDA